MFVHVMFADHECYIRKTGIVLTVMHIKYREDKTNLQMVLE